MLRDSWPVSQSPPQTLIMLFLSCSPLFSSTFYRAGLFCRLHWFVTPLRDANRRRLLGSRINTIENQLFFFINAKGFTASLTITFSYLVVISFHFCLFRAASDRRVVYGVRMLIIADERRWVVISVLMPCIANRRARLSHSKNCDVPAVQMEFANGDADRTWECN